MKQRNFCSYIRKQLFRELSITISIRDKLALLRSPSVNDKQESFSMKVPRDWLQKIAVKHVFNFNMHRVALTIARQIFFLFKLLIPTIKPSTK